MKNIINYLGALLAVVLIGTTFTACSDNDGLGSADVGLGIKTFFPRKVVPNQPITINGSGFLGATEIRFPGGVTVTDFEVVSNDMIRVNTPAAIAEEGGKLIVRSADDEVESPLPMTVGHTVVTGFSKQPGEQAGGGELITVFGSDLEFINAVELLDPDSVWQLIDHKDFYRKGTSNLIFRVPLKNIYKGTFVGKLHTYDGLEIPMPELTYEPAADEGHMEIVKTTIWKNDGSAGPISWSGIYRFCLEGHDFNNECIAEFSQDVWDKIKSETFYVTLKGEDPQVRVTSGWWSTTWTGVDIQPGNELLEDLGDGLWRLTVNLSGDPLLDVLDEQHLLFTGDRYTVEEIYFIDIVSGGGGGGSSETVFWQGDGSAGAVSWNGTYRFALEGHDTNNECIAELPQDVWDKIKTGTFYVDLQAEDPQIRVTTGWWSTTWTGADFQPGTSDLLKDNGDGTWTLEINFSGDPILDVLDDQHLLLTGDRFTPTKLYYYE